MATDSLGSSSPTSQNKRLKTLTPKLKSIVTDDHGQESQEPDSSEDDSQSRSCGICLSEGGCSISGEIDSCSHYFCFVCIMEWAKVESRCPMCKRRFTSIRRPPKHGVFPCERIVNVPQRDQVYHLFGNATTESSDPFARMHCNVCHNMVDEYLLLLCDLCDTAAHTYCVGLGHTVPDGDWFCHDCSVSRAEHEKTEIDADSDNRGTFRNSAVMPPNRGVISVFNIEQESNDPIVDLSVPRVISLRNHLSPPVEGEPCIVDGVTGPGRRADQNIVGQTSQFSARTLHHCRNVHSHIQALRENWNALRSGSLRFSSSLVEPCSRESKRNNGTAVFPNSSSKPNSSSSASKQSTPHGASCCGEHKRESHDIDKAWKMMDIAKSKWNSESGSSAHKSPKSLCISKGQKLGTRNWGSTGMEKQGKYFPKKRR